MDKKPSSPPLSWRQKANIKYCEDTVRADVLAKQYAVPVEMIYKIWSVKRNAADKEFTRVTGKDPDFEIDEFLKWRKEIL